ncbi:MAG: DUF4255 domain-containing protein [Prochloraceae cyanobacterium]|nr:DUF4255 domain-containing protein [Prochloraceae cyanobacterium]
MLDSALSFLKQQLNDYLKIKTGTGEDTEDPFVKFILDQNETKIDLEKGKITILLVNLEEEQLFRAGAASSNSIAKRTNSQTNPDLYINLYIMFVCFFARYEDTLKYLSSIIKFFQSHRLFEGKNHPTLNPDIEKLTLELVNSPFSEQKDIWSLLGRPFIPSVIYKVRMVVFKDRDTLEVPPTITETQLISSQL